MKRVRRTVLMIVFAALGLFLFPGLELSSPRAADQDKAVVAYKEGNGLFDQNRFADAAAAYDRAIAEDPQYAEAYHNRALANEMVDRQKALHDWRRFADIGAARPELKYDLGRAQARVQMLEYLPQFPEALQPTRYIAAEGDYYWSVSTESEGDEWKSFLLKVFLGSAPELKWQQGTREAFDAWSKVIPLTLVALPKSADIRMGWEESRLGEGHAGEEQDWVKFHYEGGELKRRKYAVITVDLSRMWSKDEMKAIIAHEIGHALGIKGHSPNKGDIMYWQVQEKMYQVGVRGIPLPLFWRSLVKQPSQRDLNTLIRIYNSAGSGKRFP